MLFAPTHSLLSSPQALLAEGIGGLGGMLPILLMFAVVYFIVLRPMSKQEKDRRKRVDGLKKGDQVVLGGGILGRISNADDDKIAIVEIADKVKIRVLKKDISDTQAGAMADDKSKKGSDKGSDKTSSKDKDAKSATEDSAGKNKGKAAKGA